MFYSSQRPRLCPEGVDVPAEENRVRVAALAPSLTLSLCDMLDQVTDTLPMNRATGGYMISPTVVEV